MKNNIPEGILTECAYHVSNLNNKIIRLQHEKEMFHEILENSVAFHMNKVSKDLADSDTLFGLLMHYKYFHTDRCNHDLAVRVLDEKGLTFINNFEQVYKQIYHPRKIESILHKMVIETPAGEIIEE